jgi:sugar diacid utilization regulator
LVTCQGSQGDTLAARDAPCGLPARVLACAHPATAPGTAMTLEHLLAALPDDCIVVSGNAAELDLQRVLEVPAHPQAALPGTLYLVPDAGGAAAQWLARRRDVALLAPARELATLLGHDQRAVLVALQGERIPLDLAARVQRALAEVDTAALTPGSVAAARQELIDDVLHQRFNDPHAVLTRARGLGLELAEARIALVAAIDDVERFYLAHADEGEPFIQRAKGALALAVRNAAQRHDPRAAVALLSDAAVALITDPQAAPRIAADAARAARRELGLAPVAVATGNAKERWTELGVSYREARLALELRRRLRLRKRDVAFSEVTGAALLHLLDADSEVTELLAFELAPLLEADRVHRTRLVETLAAWFDAGSSLKRAADALSVHPKTLRYRLDRIADLLGVDALASDRRLLYYLAAKWWLWHKG